MIKTIVTEMRGHGNKDVFKINKIDSNTHEIKTVYKAFNSDMNMTIIDIEELESD